MCPAWSGHLHRSCHLLVSRVVTAGFSALAGGGLLDGTETKYGKTLLLDSRVTLYRKHRLLMSKKKKNLGLKS